MNKPVPCGMYVYEDLKNYVGGVYEPLTGQENLGGHLVCIVGFDDSQSCWIVKNSWGPDWGEDGFFRINYNQTSIHSPAMLGLEALDLEYGDIVVTSTTTSTEPIPTTTTSMGPDDIPNLLPCAPDGWTYPIVPASKRGTNEYNPEAGDLYPTPRMTYIDLALCNDSETTIKETFTVAFFIDGLEVFSSEIDGDLDGKSYRVWFDKKFGLSKGEHILKIITDVNDDVIETNEKDNVFEMSFNWDAPVWPLLYGTMFAENASANIRLLRDFRDQVLLRSKTGRAYVAVLYKHSFKTALLLLNDRDLRRRTATFIGGMVPLVSRVLSGDRVAVPSRTISAFETLMDEFAQKSPPGMRSALAMVKEGVRAQDLFNELGILIK